MDSAVLCCVGEARGRRRGRAGRRGGSGAGTNCQQLLAPPRLTSPSSLSPSPTCPNAAHHQPHPTPPSQAKIDNAGGETLRRAKERVAKLGARIAEAEAAAAKMRAQAKAAGKQLDKLRKDAGKTGRGRDL